MLEALTWNQFFSTLAFGLIAYYLVVAILYYPKELRNLVSGKSIELNLIHRQEKKKGLSRTEEVGIEPFEELEVTVAELSGILGRAGSMTEKHLLVEKISQILSNHPGLREPAYRVAIENFLSENIPKQTPFLIEPNELKVLWNN